MSHSLGKRNILVIRSRAPNVPRKGLTYHPLVDLYTGFLQLFEKIFRRIHLFSAYASVVLLIAFEICLGMLFVLKRKYLQVALIFGILFCLGSMPVMVQAIYTNLPLALIQVFLLWKEIAQHNTIKIR